MAEVFRKCLNILNNDLTFHEFGVTFSFSILDVIIFLMVLGLFFRIFYAIYDR